MALDLSKFEDLCTNCGLPVVGSDECSWCSGCGSWSHSVCGPVHQHPTERSMYMGIITRRGDHP